MRILVIDNYDSFTYNLVALLRLQGAQVSVARNDKIKPQTCLEYDRIFLSPGPGIPAEAGNLMEIIDQCVGKRPVFGVCLGHQAIAEYLGGHLKNLPVVFHGVQTPVQVVQPKNRLFNNIPGIFQAGRYHSWVVDPSSPMERIQVLAVDDHGHIMALQDETETLRGIQFHPESVLTPCGAQLLKNELAL